MSDEVAWRNFFTHAFSESEAGLLYEMILRLGKDWRAEWQQYTQDATLVIEDISLKVIDRLDKDLQSHRDAIIQMRAQMDVLIGRPIEDNVVDVQKFIKDNRVTKSGVPDALVERLSDLERQSARIERQVKTILNGLTTDRKVKEGMTQSLTRRVDKLETELKGIAEEVE